MEVLGKTKTVNICPTGMRYREKTKSGDWWECTLVLNVGYVLFGVYRVPGIYFLATNHYTFPLPSGELLVQVVCLFTASRRGACFC